MPKSRAIDPSKFRDNPKQITKYLNAALSTGDAAKITKAIGDMIRAQGMSRFAEKVGLRREGLYRSFRGQVAPGFDTVINVLLALNVQLTARPSGHALKKSR